MNTHTRLQLDLESTDVLEVELSGWANVVLLDEMNYENFRTRKKFTGVGAFVKRSPYRLSPPKSGKWNLVIYISGINMVLGSYKIIRQVQKVVLLSFWNLLIDF